MPLGRGETVAEAYVRLHADGSGIPNDIRDEMRNADGEFERAGERHGDFHSRGFERTSGRGFRRNMDRLESTLDKRADSFERIGEKIGNAFGRGSRNDFINAFGGFVSLAPRVLAGLTRIGQGAARSARQFSEMKAKSGFFPALARSVGGLAGTLATLAIAVLGAFEMMQPLGALISTTTGLVVALAGSLSFALVGGLIAVAGAIVPLVAGLGVAVLAISGLSKKAKIKEFKDSIKELKGEFKDMQRVAAEGVFGKNGGNLAALPRIFKAVEPIVKTVSAALGGLLKSFGQVAQSKAFLTLMQDLSKILGPMVTQLGRIGGNLAIGVLQLFRDASPLIGTFVGWLDRLVKGFKDAGDIKSASFSPLVQFLIRAGDSARAVGGFISETIGLIGDLFSAGSTTGDSIFRDLTKQVKNVRDWLADPANKDTINQWFQDAQKLAGAVGTIAQKAIEFVDALDTPTSRNSLFKILTAIGDILDSLTYVAGEVDKVNQKFLETKDSTESWLDTMRENLQKTDFGKSFGKMWGEITAGIPVQVLIQRFREAKQGVEGPWSAVAGFFSRVWSQISQSVSGFASSFVTMWSQIFQGVPVQTLVQRFNEAKAGVLGAWNGVVGFFAGIWASISQGAANAWGTLTQRVSEAVNGVKAFFLDLYNWLVGNSLIPDLVMAIAAWFARLPGLIGAALTSLAPRFAAWIAGVPGVVRAGVTRIVAAFSNLAGKSIANAGNIASRFSSWMSGLPGRARTVVSQVVSAWAGAAGRSISRAGSIASAFAGWVSSLPGRARTTASNIANAFRGTARNAVARMGSLAEAMGGWGQRAAGEASRIASGIVSRFRGLSSRIEDAIGTIHPRITMPTIPRPHVTAIVDVPKKTASGGIFSGAQTRIIGEAGPEAVVPLNRALSRVDPAVRALSAFAQGKMDQLAGGGGNVGKSIDARNWQIITPSEDPRAVAAEVMSRFAAAAYI